MTTLTATPLQNIYAQRCGIWSDIVEHLPRLHDTVVERNAQTVVELGVRSGNSTVALLAGIEQTGGQLWSVDIHLMPYQDYAILRRASKGSWTFVIGDDLAVSDQIPDQIDVLFIDSSHFYDHTLAELDLYGSRASTILLHDTELEHPDGAPNAPAFPVRTAIEEWCAETGRTWLNLTNCYGLGIIAPLEA